jgi:hypothetical protein
MRAWYQVPLIITDYADFAYLWDDQGLDISEVADRAGNFGTFNDVLFLGHNSITPVPLAMAVSDWFCLEWHVSIGNPGTMQVFVNGAEIPQLTINENMTHGNPPGSLWIGLIKDYLNKASPPAEAWVDDVAVDITRIGCQ